MIDSAGAGEVPRYTVKVDDGGWRGQGLEDTTGQKETRLYAASLKKGPIGNPGPAKLEALWEAMGFPPALWFGNTEGEGRATDDTLMATLEDETLRLRLKDRRLLLGIARQISTSAKGG